MSLSIDVSSIMSNAFVWVNNLLPVYAVPLGITVGFSLITMIAGLLMKAFRGGRG